MIWESEGKWEKKRNIQAVEGNIFLCNIWVNIKSISHPKDCFKIYKMGRYGNLEQNGVIWMYPYIHPLKDRK